MVTVLGYISYLFICLFSPLQLFLNLRKKNVNLGPWPLIALTLGLVLLQVSFFWVTVPTYVFVGNFTSMTFTALNLVNVLRQRPPRIKLNPMQEYERSILSMAIPMQLFRRRTRPVLPKAYAGSEAVFPTMNFAEAGPPPLKRSDFVPCKTCGALVFEDGGNAVDIRVQDVAWLVHNDGLLAGTPLLETIHTVRTDYYCKRDRPPYDRQDFYPCPIEGGGTKVEYFKRTMTDEEYRNVKEAHGAAFRPTEPFRQVTEDGEQYD